MPFTHVPYSQYILVLPDLEAAVTLLVDFCGGFITLSDHWSWCRPQAPVSFLTVGGEIGPAAFNALIIHRASPPLII